MSRIAEKSLQELRNFTITKVKWRTTCTFSLELSDGQTCKAGTMYDVDKSHSFDLSKKINRIECIINKYEIAIMQIHFYHQDERLVVVGMDEDLVKREGGRVEVFDIAIDEQLVGCKLERFDTFSHGIL
jgi:hypothetical protein